MVVTTTKENIHNENSTRVFNLSVAENQKQIGDMVQETILKGDLTHGISDEEKEQTLKLHHNIQNILEPVRIHIPYSKHITFPSKTERHKRNSLRFMNLIRVVAYLRQMQKEKKTINGMECIESDLDDYQIAFDIGRDIIRATLNQISIRAQNVLVACCKINDRHMVERKDPFFRIKEIENAVDELGLDLRNRQDLYKHLDILEEYEYLERKQSGRGATKYYKVCFAYKRNENGEIINIDSPDINEILTPEQLEEIIRTQHGGPEMVREKPDQQERKFCKKVDPVRKKYHLTYDGKTGIAKTKGFQKKQLADFACNIGDICHFGCTFCYVPAMVTKQKGVQDILKEGYGWDEISHYRTKENLVKCVERDLKKIEPGDKRTVIFCTTCDPCATEGHADITISAIRLIMKSSDLQVRVLSKSTLILEIAKELDDYRERIMYGLSTGTIRPEISDCIEGNASPILERIKTLEFLQNTGYRTYGMLCPILPSEMPHLRKLVEAINPNQCEYIWVEALNVRGKSLVKTRDHLKQCGLDEDAISLEKMMGNKSGWRDYAKDLFLKAREELKEHGASEKLRYLQYVTREPEEFVEFFKSQKEAMCL